MQFNYSVIIPFRDCTNLLHVACNSIPVRDDIQVIVVDNAKIPIGTDAIKGFGNPNIEYYTSSSVKGAGCARNEGMKHAKGKFLLFLDADDYFTPNAFKAFDAEIETDCDIVYFNATSVFIGTDKPGNRHYTINDRIITALKDGNLDILRYQFANPVCKMVRKSLVDQYHLQYQEVPASNDVMFSLQSGHFARKVKAVNKIVYVITVGESGSSLTRTHSLEIEESRFHVFIDWYSFLREVGRLDMCPRVIGFIFKGYRYFGFRVFLKWLFYALRNNVNIFRGLSLFR